MFHVQLMTWCNGPQKHSIGQIELCITTVRSFLPEWLDTFLLQALS